MHLKPSLWLLVFLHNSYVSCYKLKGSNVLFCHMCYTFYCQLVFLICHGKLALIQIKFSKSNVFTVKLLGESRGGGRGGLGGAGVEG